jgi:hypothetical protein
MLLLLLLWYCCVVVVVVVDHLTFVVVIVTYHVARLYSICDWGACGHRRAVVGEPTYLY